MGEVLRASPERRGVRCPECKTELAHESGCLTCYGCGWSACG